MKLLFTFLFFITATCAVQAQKLSVAKKTAIGLLNEKVKETVGNIRFFTERGKKQIIEKASFTDSEMGVMISISIQEDGGGPTTFTYEFNPADIANINEVGLPKASPVGQLKIVFDNNIAHKIRYIRNNILLDETYSNEIPFAFLKVDEGNYQQVRAAFFTLKEIYIDEEKEQLRPLMDLMEKDTKFWVSTSGASNTYSLNKVFVNGCTIRMMYNLQSIGLKGDVKQNYLTVIPLRDIESVFFDKSKSKPNCIILEAGKKGFLTYELKDGVYKPTRAVSEIPIFVDITENQVREELMEILKKQVKACGGGKIKL